MVDEAFLARWVTRLRQEEPGAVAVLLKGSYARGNPGPHSDVDFDVLTEGEPRVPYPVYLEELPRGRLLHVSVAVKQLDHWLTREDEAAYWSYSLPSEECMRLLWAKSDEVRERLTRPALQHPPGDAEMEDFVEEFGKVKNARAAGDELALRLAAQELAHLCPSLLRLINRETRVGSRLEALRAVLDLPASPPGYREDMLLCLGLSGRASMLEEVYDAARRLALGVLELLHLHSKRLASEIQPYLPEYLADGALQRYAAQQ